MIKTEKYKISRCGDGICHEVLDHICVEAPLEIRLKYWSDEGVVTKSLSVTMRTPGDDEDLARGFLYGEGIISSQDDVLGLERLEENVLLVKLNEGIRVEPILINRNFHSSAACGVCGKASMESLNYETRYMPWKSTFRMSKKVLYGLPSLLTQSQGAYTLTGGIHACGWIDDQGKMRMIREDVGRHNAMDKLIGAVGQYPMDDGLILTSGRIGSELVQKAGMAGVPMLAGIGAPSTMAIDMARSYGLTLVGFLKSNSFNLYCGIERIV